MATIPSKRCARVAASITSASSLTGVIVSGDVGSDNCLQQRSAFTPWPIAQVVAVEGEQVEHDVGVVPVSSTDALERVSPVVVVGDDLAVEDDVAVGGRRHGAVAATATAGASACRSN